ncbi:hypothetical protein VP1G_00177 [Cytospora mali]|uniref:Uncharacterized protein n=1 Tax=Cytospora mali TaxID=578113 RepID=A0A194ULU2_CYTMA|nr:hypothetical protein VP1G_00177 [Valsa mali var. pyri (nom. inval.)]
MDKPPPSRPRVLETWRPTTREAFPPQPTLRPIRARHTGAASSRTYNSRVLADPTIPEHLTSPPSNTFAIALFTQRTPTARGVCAVCRMSSPSLTLESDEGAGLAKGDLVRGLMGYLYGREMPFVYDQDEVEVQ